MKRFSLLACLLMFSVACGVSGSGGGPYRENFEARFINKGTFTYTMAMLPVDDTLFQAIMEERWKMAQQEIASKPMYDLRGVKISDPDPRALSFEPKNVTVHSEPDIPAVIINAIPNCQHCPYSDPTGFLYCPANSSGSKYCNAWMNSMCDVTVPAGHPEYVGPYEFENCILYGLGNNVSGR